MDLFLSPDVIDLAGGDCKGEEGDDHDKEADAAAALGDFDSFLLGRDDISFIYSHQEQVFKQRVFPTKLNPFKEEEDNVGEKLGGSLLSLSSGSWYREHVSSSVSVHFR